MPNVYSRLSVSSLLYMLLSYTGVLGLVDCGQIRGTGMGRTACGAKPCAGIRPCHSCGSILL